MLRSLLFLLCLVGVCFAADECTLSTGQFVLVSSLRDCFRRIPLDDVVKNGTVEAVKFYAEANAFTSWYKNGGPVYPDTQVDVMAELERIKNTNYEFDWLFHEDIVTVIRRANDGHFSYSVPSSYRSFFIFRPFFLTVIKEDDQLHVYALDETAVRNEGYSFISGIDVTNYLGQRIVKIDGQEVLQYLESLLPTVGYFNDRSSRFNFLVSVAFSFASLPRFRLPSSDTQTYTFLDSEGSEVDVELPYLVQVVSDFADTDDFQFQLLSSTPKASNLHLPTSLHHSRFLRADISDFQREKYTWKQLLSNHKSILRTHRQPREIGYTYELPGTMTYVELNYANKLVAILKLESFLEAPLLFLNGLDIVLTHASESKPEVLLLDVSDNGGGYGSLSYVLAYLLTGIPNSKLADAWGAIRAPANNLLFRLYDSSGSMYNLRTGLYQDNWYDGPSDKIVVNNEKNRVTRRYAFLVDPNYNSSFTSQLGITMNEFSGVFKRIFFLSNGLCGSACSIFTTKLLTTGFAEAITYGGLPGQPMDTSAFAANVYDSSETVQPEYEEDAREFPLFPTNARITWSPRLMYNSFSLADRVPRQFTRIEARYKLDIWPAYTAYNIWTLYDKALEIAIKAQ